MLYVQRLAGLIIFQRRERTTVEHTLAPRDRCSPASLNMIVGEQHQGNSRTAESPCTQAGA
jgi:hypothetical protein